MIIKNLKLGFTLVELVVVMAIFAVLAVVAANFLIATVSTSNRTVVENEVRQNASLIMEDMVAEIRKGSCVYFASNTMTISNAPATTSGCGSYPTYNTTAFSLSSGQITKSVNGVAPSTISSPKVLFCNNINPCDNTSTCTGGMTVSPTGPTGGAIDISLSVRQSNPTARRDSCAKVVLSETVTPRNVGN